MKLNIHNDYFKWWCGTVIVGALPIFIRIIVYTLTNKNIELFNVIELICFGFSIQVSSIYFCIGKPSKQTENNLTINTTVSVIFIVIFSVVYIISMLEEGILNLVKTKLFVIITCIISLYVGQNSVKCAIINSQLLEQE